MHRTAGPQIISAQQEMNEDLPTKQKPDKQSFELHYGTSQPNLRSTYFKTGNKMATP